MIPIKKLDIKFDVRSVQKELDANSDMWDKYPLRTSNNKFNYFDGTSDIWIRANDISKFDKENPAAFIMEHHPVWYEDAKKLPSIFPLIFELMSFVKGEELGGILITRVPAGKEIKPHIDTGWHQEYYDKYAIQIKGHSLQSFNFPNHYLSTIDGECFWFDNTYLHWVLNPSNEERITMIVAIKPFKGEL